MLSQFEFEIFFLWIQEEPVKYYMKYLSKPPLFADQSKGNKEKGPSESYKEFIEAQKTKAVERDQRYLIN